MLAVIGDTHLPRGARRLPGECLRLLAEAEVILHVGDFTAASVLTELRRLGRVEAVRGNMDDRELKAMLPERKVIEVEGVRIGLVHDGGPAAGRHERLGASFLGCDVVVYGHSHLPEVARVAGTWIVNPGSPTERRRAQTHTMSVLEGGVPRLIALAGRA
jgi:putative phosphoesterase